MNGFLKSALVASALAIPVIFFWEDLQTIFGNKVPVAVANMNGSKKTKDKKSKAGNEATPSDNIILEQQWEMPDALREISGIAFLNNNRFACVQDELGTIYIYNTGSSKVEKEIAFGSPGDYEGIAVAGNTAYVLRADGKIFEVSDYMNTAKPVKEYSTSLTAKQDVEGLAFDQKNNRLLLAIKGKEPNANDYKGIYAFDLTTKKMAATPVYKIDLTHSIWSTAKENGKGKKGKGKGLVEPSDLEVHPTTGDIYIVDGPNPKLLILDKNGTPKDVYTLSKSDFEQPEGLAFTPAGELYISSEGGNGAGTIARVTITP